MNNQQAENSPGSGITTVLREPLFRRMWLSSIFSNLGLMMQGVGAAWVMTQMTSSADLVALVQTAQAAPVLLFALTAGAIADTYDRRHVALAALLIIFFTAIALAAVTWFKILTPQSLLTACFLVGTGMALLWPAWQAAIAEQVTRENLPNAVALNSISFNSARAVGPAIGGFVVAAAGAVAAFAAQALLCMPLILVLYFWRRSLEPPRFPPETLKRAMLSGIRYVGHSPDIRRVLTRTFLTIALGSSLLALLPLVAKHLLAGDASTYGISLGAFGFGAILGALILNQVRNHLTPEQTLRWSAVVLAITTATVALSRFAPLTWSALFFAGAAWLITFSHFNVAVQFSAPRWVAARVLSAYQACNGAGIALGGWGWGTLADLLGIPTALLIASCGLAVLSFAGLWLKMPKKGQRTELVEPRSDPEVRLQLTERSGPIRIQFEYKVNPDKARAFYRLMQEVRRFRHRNGGYGWSLSRDIADPYIWIENFSCPTWLDYLRLRNRGTQTERNILDMVKQYHMGPEPIRIRRRLERPLGSVRWKDDVPDRDFTPGGEVPSPSIGT